MKKRLRKYRSLDLMNIEINYGGKVIRFNLYDELKIDDTNAGTLGNELKFQPSSYGFLILLHKKLLSTFETLKQRRKKAWASAYLSAKKSSQTGTRFLPDEMAKAEADNDSKYNKLTLLCIKAKDDADTIFACMKSFEQRKDLLQTLSSNNRKF